MLLILKHLFFKKIPFFLFRNLSSGFVLIINELSKMTDTDNTYNNIEELLPRFCEGMTTAAEKSVGGRMDRTR